MQKQALNPLNKECRKNNKSNMELWLMFIKLNVTRPIKVVEDKKANDIVRGVPWTTLDWKYDAYNIKRGHIIEKPVGQQDNSTPDSQKQIEAEDDKAKVKEEDQTAQPDDQAGSMQLSNVADEPSISQSAEQSGEEKPSAESSEQEPKTAVKCPANDATPSRDG